MALIGDLFIKLGLSSASFNTDVDKATAKFKQSAGEMKQAARKESQEARAAVDLLGNAIGVQMPREVRKFIASSDAIAPALAVAFKTAIVVGFTTAIGAAIVKAVEWVQAWRTSEEVLKQVEERVRSVAAAWNQMSMATLTAAREQLRTQQRELQTRIDALGNQQDRAGRIGSPLTAPFAAGEAIAARQGINALIPQMDALRKAEDEVMLAMARLTKEGMDKQTAAAKKLHNELVEAAKKIKMLDFVPPSLLTFAEKTEKVLALLEPRGQIATAMLKLNKEVFDFGAEGRKIFEETRLPVEKLANTLTHLRELLAAGTIGMGTFQRATAAAKEQSGLMADATGRIADSSRQMASIFVSNIGDMIVGARSFSEALGGIAQAIQRMILQIALLEPLERFLRGFLRLGGGGGVSSINLAAFTGGSALIPQFAGGGDFGPGRMITVGERGPELLFTGNQSGTIIPNGRGLGGITVQNIIDARGAEVGVETRIERALAQVAPQIVAAAVRAGRELNLRSA